MSGQIDLYNILEELGSGTYGKVCKIRRKADGKDMVWKEINFGETQVVIIPYLPRVIFTFIHTSKQLLLEV
jgi:hypothetical protein